MDILQRGGLPVDVSRERRQPEMVCGHGRDGRDVSLQEAYQRSVCEICVSCFGQDTEDIGENIEISLQTFWFCGHKSGENSPQSRGQSASSAAQDKVRYKKQVDHFPEIA